MCQVQDVDGRSELFSIGAGTVYVGCLDSRPCLYVTTRTMQDWVDERWGDGPDVPAGAAVAYCFDTEERRTAFVRGKDWNRLVEGYLKEEMWELFKASASVEVSRQEFELAYIDALDAIRELPCKACGALDWPVITKPTGAAWMDDPGPDFSCRSCGQYLADPFAYSKIRHATSNYPHEGVVDRRQLPKFGSEEDQG